MQRVKNWTVILAAGASKRFRGVKALAVISGQSFLSRALFTAHAFSEDRVLVVTGGHADSITPALGETRHIYNARWEEGMGASIAKGIQEVLRIDPDTSTVTLLPVDQPWVTLAHLNDLLSLSIEAGSCIFTGGKDFVGPPAVVPSSFFGRLLVLQGEKGVKSVLTAGEYQTISNLLASQDYDSPEDLDSP